MTFTPIQAPTTRRRRPRLAKDETIAALLREKGLRHTQPRQAIYQLLLEAARNNAYVDAKSLYRRSFAAGDDVGLASIGRILVDFENHGLVSGYSFDGLAKMYTLEASQTHHHLIDLDSGQVWPFSDHALEGRIEAYCLQRGVEFVRARTTIYVNTRGALDGFKSLKHAEEKG